jgi:hypothetical protein
LNVQRALILTNRVVSLDVLETLGEAGISEIGVVTGGRRASKVIRLTAALAPTTGQRVQHINSRGNGIPRAIADAGGFVNGEPFLVVTPGAGLAGGDLRPVLEEFERRGDEIVVLLGRPTWTQRRIAGYVLAPGAADTLRALAHGENEDVTVADLLRCVAERGGQVGSATLPPRANNHQLRRSA